MVIMEGEDAWAWEIGRVEGEEGVGRRAIACVRLPSAWRKMEDRDDRSADAGDPESRVE
jgi:hypothetical protein